jgi:hypothetical protein
MARPRGEWELGTISPFFDLNSDAYRLLVERW